jgi:cellulose synthase/poly-beta-1,6-N-acetylglucosamine synthase-like glycosyltransferase
MKLAAAVLLTVPIGLFLYAYGLYPLLLRVARTRQEGRPAPTPAVWPTVSVLVTAYNAGRTIRATLEQLLAVDYPPDRLQIVVASDASTDATDDIVRELAPRGVALHRVPTRGGKTVAENTAAVLLRGEIVVNVDASAHVLPDSVKALVRAFADPAVGVVSGRAVSVAGAADGADGGRGDLAYYTYEMWVRSLEMHFGAVIGATGALYAVRRPLFVTLPPHVTRDFASPLAARERGYRSAIEHDAVCYVRRTPSLAREYARKVRTMVQGLDTLYEFRHLMNPIRHGWFALMLTSHKLCRWLVYLTAPLAAAVVLLLAIEWWPARYAALAGLVVALVGLAAMRWPGDRRVPAPLAVCGYALVGGAAGAAAWRRFLRGDHVAVWEPTARPG